MRTTEADVQAQPDEIPTQSGAAFARINRSNSFSRHFPRGSPDRTIARLIAGGYNSRESSIDSAS